jgi:Fic family protein
MLIPPKYHLTNKISELLSSIQGSRDVIESLIIPPEIELNIRRKSTLNSSLYSARIEGNQLTMDRLSSVSPKDQKKIEVYNILKALNWIKEKKRKELTEKDILTLHKITMNGLINLNNLGRLRNNMEAIFNSAGIAIYMPPPPRLINPSIVKLTKYINSSKEQFVPIKAVLAHYSFEKIHPFLDGSGRVGRLLIQMTFHNQGYGMKGILPLEEYLDNHRNEYYQMLEEPEKDTTDYIEFMLGAVSEAAKKGKEIILQNQSPTIEDSLLPRRAEILRIIKDHKMINFDQIRRRFTNINERTLRYDIKKLLDNKLINKLGITKGVYYTIQRSSSKQS